MPDPPVASNHLTRRCAPGLLVTNVSSPALAVLASVGPAERHEFSVGEVSVEFRSESIDSTGGEPNRSPQRSAFAGDVQLGVRRAHVSSMSPDRREQAISAIADLLIVQFEREAHQAAPDAQSGGTVAGNESKQEELP